MRRWLWLALALAAFALAAGCRQDDTYPFAVVGDLQPPDDADYLPVTRRLVAQIADGPALFVVIVGDLVSGTDPKRWTQFDQLVEPLRAKDKTIFAVIGNNDSASAAMVAGFDERFGAHNQTIAMPGMNLVLLDSEAHANGYRHWELGREQEAWLETRPWRNDPDAGPNPLLFFFLHRPVYRSEIMKLDPTGKYGVDQPEVARRLADLGADAVFAGHEHLFEKHETETFTQVITGGGGGKLLPTGYHHYLLVTISPRTRGWKVEAVRVADAG